MRSREHRQERSLHRHVGTIVFFRNHPSLARTTPGRRALRVARVWVPIIRRELRRTRADQRAHESRRQLAAASGPFPLDSCTRKLLAREGGMNPHAKNPKSGAYGGPQALPGSKMTSAGADWADNIWTQIRWMQGYVSRWGGMCAALAHSYAYGWY